MICVCDGYGDYLTAVAAEQRRRDAGPRDVALGPPGRWAFLARDSRDNIAGIVSCHRTRWGASRAARRWARTAGPPLEPFPGRPLYTLHVERLPAREADQ